MITGKVARELHTKSHARNNYGNRGCTGESGFDPVGLWVMGPPCGLKLGRLPVYYPRGHAQGVSLGTGGVQESQVSILWNYGLWAHDNPQV